MALDRTSLRMQLLRTVHLGIAFMLILSADNARSNVMKLFNKSVGEDNPHYTVDGYVVLGLTYIFYGFSMLVAPAVITSAGPRGAMIIGTVMMTVFLYLLTLEQAWATYLGVCLTGIGGSFLWVGQGNYLVLNSEPPQHGLHVSLFWAIFTLSFTTQFSIVQFSYGVVRVKRRLYSHFLELGTQLEVFAFDVYHEVRTMVGNIYSAVSFAGKTRLDYETRRNLVFAMFFAGIIASLLFCSLRPAGRKTPQALVKESALEASKKTLAISISREFLILLTTFAFIGFQQSFGWGVHSACVGFTNSFGSFATELAPITAVVYGAGGTLGGTIHVIAPYLHYNWIRRHIFAVGYALQTAAFVGIFLNLPNSSVFGKTDEEPYLQQSMVWLACVCSFLMGMGDSFYNTQLYKLLAELHPDFSAHTVALFKFAKSIAMAAFYFASINAGLHIQILIMMITGFVGVICFWDIDRKIINNHESNVKPIE